METTWFVLWGLLWGIYFMLDGYDLGAGILMPFVAKNENDRKKIFNAIGPFWDGNEVWLITAGGVTFAAFPGTYAVMFSALYTPLMLILFALIFRGAGLALREEATGERARNSWDWMFIIGSFLAALLLGVAFGNIFKGIPIDYQGIFQGNLFTLLNPYGLLAGVLFLLFFIIHGAIWLAFKTKGELQKRCGDLAWRLWSGLVTASIAFLGLSALQTHLWAIYARNSLLFIVPLITVLSLLTMGHFLKRKSWKNAWFASSLYILSATLFGVIGIYPALLPSSLNEAYSRTIHNTASSPMTLKIMLVVALIFVPLVLIYQAWTYKVFAGKVGGDESGYHGGI